MMGLGDFDTSIGVNPWFWEKSTILARDVNNGEGSARVGARCIRIISVPASQFCSKSETSLRKESLKDIKESNELNIYFVLVTLTSAERI